MIQVLKNTQAVLDVTFNVGDADSPPSVLITDLDGATVASGTGTHTGSAGSGHYTFTLPPQANENSLNIKWTGLFGGVSESLQFDLEIIGDVLFTLADLRTYKDDRLANATTYPDAALLQKRTKVAEMFYDYCRVSFVPRFRRVVLDGSWRTTLWLPDRQIRSISALKINGAAIDLTTVAIKEWGQLQRIGWWPGYPPYNNVQVDYVHGYAHPPDDIREVAMLLARYELVNSDLSDRMITFQNDLGVTRLSVPGTNNPTGIPLVDQTLNRYSAGYLVDEMAY